MAVTAQPALVAPGRVECLTEGDADVLDRVVGVDFQIAIGVDRQVHEAVPADLVEHVVEKRQPGREAAGARAVEVDGDGNLRFFGVTLYARSAIVHDRGRPRRNCIEGHKITRTAARLAAGAIGIKTMLDQTAALAAVKTYLLDLQDRICTGLGALDGQAFHEDSWVREEGGGGRSRVLAGGQVFEQAGVNFSDVQGSRLPPAATAKRPELEGRAFHAMGVSLVVHPLNPYAPTSHANVRFFIASKPGAEPV